MGFVFTKSTSCLPTEHRCYLLEDFFLWFMFSMNFYLKNTTYLECAKEIKKHLIFFYFFPRSKCFYSSVLKIVLEINVLISVYNANFFLFFFLTFCYFFFLFTQMLIKKEKERPREFLLLKTPTIFLLPISLPMYYFSF